METLKQIYCFLIIHGCCKFHFNNKVVIIQQNNNISSKDEIVYMYVCNQKYSWLRAFKNTQNKVIDLLLKSYNVSYIDQFYYSSKEIWEFKLKTIFINKEFISQLKQYIDGKS